MAVFTIIITGLLSKIALIQCQPMVTVEQGTLMGKTVKFENDFLGMNKDIDVYLGIPYAEPPVGERRFAPPLRKEPWNEDDIYNATYFRDICMQVHPEANLFSMSEDCLHLNVYAPNPKPLDAAVMVFIHGGGFTTGNGYQGFYGGSALVAVGDVIIVTINYRLTTFGYLTTGDESSPGNYGMLDQVEALRWINTNINAFGGDANRITIFGESAGGSSVSAHMFSPHSEPLFQQAILQSGSSLEDWSLHEDLEEQREIAFKIGEQVGCSATNTQDLISCMRQVDAEVLNQASYQFGYYAALCVDNNFLVELPRTSAKNNNFKKCPLIHGFNKDEASVFILYSFPSYLNSSETPYVSKKRFDRELTALLTAYGRYINDLIEQGLTQVYLDWSKVDDPAADYYEDWKNIATDYWYSCPAIFEARLHAMAAVHDVYLYFFTHVPSVTFYASPVVQPKWLGATHGEELQFVFGYPFEPSSHLEFHKYPEEEMTLSLRIMKYWTNFAKTGNPNKESFSSPPYNDDTAWPAFSLPELQYKELAVNLKTGRGLKADECHFWNEHLEQLTTFTANLEETERQWREEFHTWKYTDMEEWRDTFDEYQPNGGNGKISSPHNELKKTF
ncbi:cholinesterase-like [Amphiura filiformis]|uniref:cholinesterase-like n=1 Tax=Amphiura filiformis TaxID=82378 RepID=UPI003B213CCD